MKDIPSKKNRAGKGFSLVEVLCAIVLLALVATPIIQIIYSSFTMNLKSKEMLAAADLTSDIMEYASSLAFEDFSYTKVGDSSPTVIKGAKSYYWSDSLAGCTSLGAYNSSDGTYSVCPGGARGTLVSHAALGSTTRTIGLKDVDYSGYKFRVTITIQEDAQTALNKYHFYNVIVTVADNSDSTYIYSESKTCIPNKYDN